MNNWRDDVLKRARGIRKRVLAHVIRNGGGYLSQACSAGELLAGLYSGLLKIGPSLGPAIPGAFPGVPSATNPDVSGSGGLYNGAHLPEYDRFIFSPVHYSLVLYSALIEAGRMAEDGLSHFNQDGSTVEMIGAEHSPGIELTAGSLAQAFSQAAGIAFARRYKKETGRVIVFMSDGEFQEGQTWEAIASASWFRLDNLVAIVDVNRQQCDGPMCDVMPIDPLIDRIKAFGAVAVEINAHEPMELSYALDHPHIGKPLFILAMSNPCKDLPVLKSRVPRLHYVRVHNDAELNDLQSALAILESGND